MIALCQVSIYTSICEQKKKTTKEKSGNEFIITVIIATIFFKQESHMHIFRTKKSYRTTHDHSK